MMRCAAIGILGWMMALASIVSAFSGRGGLEAVAVSPDGKIVATGGHNRVVYIVDAEKMEVRQRWWIGARITNLAFCRDSQKLLVEDESSRVQSLDVATGKVLSRVTQVRGLVCDANSVIVHDLTEGPRNRLRFLDPTNLEERGRVDLAERPVAWTIEEGGRKLAVWTASRPGEERQIPVTEVPKELRGLARWNFRLRNDGRQSALVEVELATGKILTTQQTWYSSDTDTTQLYQAATGWLIVNRINVCARINLRGETTIFETGKEVSPALALTFGGKYLWNGGIGGGTFGPIDSDKPTPFRLDELPGQAEFINRFATLADGSVYAVTSAHRLAKISRVGILEKTSPIY